MGLVLWVALLAQDTLLLLLPAFCRVDSPLLVSDMVVSRVGLPVQTNIQHLV